MANMLMDGDLVTVTYQDKTRFQGFVTAAIGRYAELTRTDNACTLEMVCMDGTVWQDEQKQPARIAVDFRSKSKRPFEPKLQEELS